MLFFTDKWFRATNDPTFLEWINYHINKSCLQNSNSHFQWSHYLHLEKFYEELTERNFKPTLNSINTIKHLMAIQDGIYPGFTIDNGEDLAGPIKAIQECYLNVYDLKHYAPIVMHPKGFCHDNFPLYYSLLFPTQLEYAKKHNKSSNIMAELREMKILTEALQNCTRENEAYNFNYFHFDEDKFREISPASLIPSSDPRFSNTENYGEKRLFPYNSPFFRGCIQIFCAPRHCEGHTPRHCEERSDEAI